MLRPWRPFLPNLPALAAPTRTCPCYPRLLRACCAAARLMRPSRVACELTRHVPAAGLTTSLEVRAAAVGVLPFVLACQVLKGLAYPLNGALMGGLDWSFSAASMWAAQIACLGKVATVVESGRMGWLQQAVAHCRRIISSMHQMPQVLSLYSAAEGRAR